MENLRNVRTILTRPNGIKLIFISLLVIPFFVQGQRVVKEKVYSKVLDDTLECNIWLPYGYEDSDNPYPVIYLHDYGMLSQYGLNIAALLNDNDHNLPKSIVVELLSTTKDKYRDLIGYNFYFENLTSGGLNFVQSLNEDIFPYINQKYHTSGFRTYLGHSYAASFANYVFNKYPRTFDAYVLFAPETLSKVIHLNRPGKSLDRKNKFFFIATGSDDIPRRKELFEKITNEYSKGNDFFFKGELIDSTGHGDIVKRELEKSLSFVYGQYFNTAHLDTLHLLHSLKKEVDNVKSIYKLTNFSFDEYRYELFSVAGAYKDKELLNYLIANDKKLSTVPLESFNLGQTYLSSFGDTTAAESYFKKSVQLAISNHSPTETYNGYLWNGILIENTSPRSAFNLYMEGYKATNEDSFLYAASRCGLKDKSLRKNGLEFIQKLIDKKDKNSLLVFGIDDEKLLKVKKDLESLP